MITTMKLWFESLRSTLTSLRALGIFIVLYALLLVSFYFFISTREATVGQVLLTYALLLLLPAEFFVLQAAILKFARERQFGVKNVLASAVKIAAVTIPVLIVGALLWWLMNKLQARYPAPSAPLVFPPAPAKAPPTHWPTLLITTLRFVLFAVALPLATIHLWIEASVCDVRASFAGGARNVFGTMGRALARAFSSESVFVYGLGLILFVLGPYLLLLPRLTFKGTKTAFTLFVVQVIGALVLMLIGWVVTLVTLARINDSEEAIEVKAPATVAESPA
jgi:F0F1-type ATP synthase assembly protein I